MNELEKNSNGIFSLTSDGKTGADWLGCIRRFGDKEVDVSEFTRNALYSHSFNQTSGVLYKGVILKGELFENEKFTIGDVRARGEELGYKKPGPELACLVLRDLLYEKISAMGDKIIVMHEPIVISGGGKRLLGIKNGGRGLMTGCFLSLVACCCEEEYEYDNSCDSLSCNFLFIL